MYQYQAIAQVQMAHQTVRCESGIWESKEKAYEELRYFITKVLPIGASYKVVQTIKTIKA